MDVIHPRCAGMDISKKDAKVCIRIQGVSGKRATSTVTMPSSAAFDPDLQAGPRSDRGWHRHFVAAGHLGDRGTVFTGQGFEQRGFHDPVENAQEHVLGEEVVLDQPWVLGLILHGRW